MKNIQAKTEEQARWNDYGKTYLQEIEENPAQHIIQISPIGHWTVYDELMMLISPMHDKKVLELGCGLGRFSVFLAKQGAKVNGVDIGFDLIAASSALAKANQINCEFEQCNITTLPFGVETFDMVLGLSVLHHLSRSDVENALRESWRVLKKGGIAVFFEPVENSKVFDFVQNLLPAGKKESRYYRPSILNRKAWHKYLSTLDDRDMTNKELIDVGQKVFQKTQISSYGFLIRLERLIGRKYIPILNKVDRLLFKFFPPLKYYCQTVLVVYFK